MWRCSCGGAAGAAGALPFLKLTAETPINHTSSHTALVLWWPSPSCPLPPPPPPSCRYTFLVYNGSVKYWHVSRPLQRAAMRKYLLPSMERVMAVLDKVPGHEEWKVRAGGPGVGCVWGEAWASGEAGKGETYSGKD